MDNILSTILVSFVFVAIGIGLFAIGWLLTGQTKIQPGACGRDPTTKLDSAKGCGKTFHCTLCDNDSPAEKENDDKIHK